MKAFRIPKNMFLLYTPQKHHNIFYNLLNIDHFYTITKLYQIYTSLNFYWLTSKLVIFCYIKNRPVFIILIYIIYIYFYIFIYLIIIYFLFNYFIIYLIIYLIFSFIALNLILYTHNDNKQHRKIRRSTGGISVCNCKSPSCLWPNIFAQCAQQS